MASTFRHWELKAYEGIADGEEVLSGLEFRFWLFVQVAD